MMKSIHTVGLRTKNKWRSILYLIIGISFLLFNNSFAQSSDLDAAKYHLEYKKEKLNISKQDLDEMIVSSSYISPTTGWFHVYYAQTYQGIEVYNGITNVTLRNGHLINIGNKFIPNLPSRLSGNNFSPSISAATAVSKAVESVGHSVTQLSQKNNETNNLGNITKVDFEEKSLTDENISAKLYWFPNTITENEKERVSISLAWNITFAPKGEANAWSIQVDASSGNILSTINQVIKCEFGAHDSGSKHTTLHKERVGHIPLSPNSYNVFDIPLESPTFGSRTVVTNPYTKFVPSGSFPGTTNGWHHDGTNSFTDTRGNNVYAQEDTDADNSGGLRPTSSTLDFNYTYTQGLNTASANQNAAITNLFYWNNLIHDVLWKYGFDEPSGNFQYNNMSRGGLGYDFVYADAQDGSSTDNANFYTPTDGSNPRMQMFLWNYPSSYEADSDFDNAIIAHEYGHGWSIRLTSGPNSNSCLYNSEQGGEGWSDYLGLMLTTDWSQLSPNLTSANLSRGIGTYVLGEATTGPGIRPYPYSYDMTNVNGAVTYAGVAYYGVFSEPHGIGSIWATILWDMTWNIILEDNQIVNDIYDTSSMVGNVAALKLVNEGLRLQSCSPSFIDARDAILAADVALFNGKYQCAIGNAFARRGVGANASTGASSNDRVVTEDFSPISDNVLTSANNIEVCNNTPLNYTITSSLSGSSYSWTRAAVSGISNPASSGSSSLINETLVNTTSSPITVQYVINILPSSCGVSNYQTFSLIVNPSLVPLISSYNICQNTNVPNGDGLVISSSQSSSESDELIAGDTYVRSNTGSIYSASSNSYYKIIPYNSSAGGNVTFEITTATFDTYLTLYKDSFDPLNPAVNMIYADDDGGSGLLSLVSSNLIANTTYYLVVGSFGTGATGQFTLTSTVPGFYEEFNWYTAPIGGTSIYTGSIFNPVGVSGSGIYNTSTALSYNYYVENAKYPECRAETTFTIDQGTVTSTSNGLINESITICPEVNNGTLTLSGMSGSIYGWEYSYDDFVTSFPINNSGLTQTYENLNQSVSYRAISSNAACEVSYSTPAKVTVIKQNDVLTGNSNNNEVEVVMHTISSDEKILPNHKVDYEAGKFINLNPGFESSASSVFLAQIEENDCPIFGIIELQPDSSTGKDADVSSVAPNNSFGSLEYMIPYTWSQFGIQDIRRSLIQFDLSSLPANAVVDSARLSLYFSQQAIQDNPSFNGHFGNNALEISPITQTWETSTVTWNNQPSVNSANSVIVPQASSQTQDYLDIDITDVVNYQFMNTNYGMLIKHQTESPYLITCLTSSEETDPLRRPKIVVYYHYY